MVASAGHRGLDDAIGLIEKAFAESTLTDLMNDTACDGARFGDPDDALGTQRP